MQENTKKAGNVVISRKRLAIITTAVVILVFFIGYGFAYCNWGMALSNTFPFQYFAGSSSLGKLVQVNELVNGEYINEPDQDLLLERALRGMMTGLQDPYSYYLDPEQAEGERQSNSGVGVGIGVWFEKDGNDEIKITEVYANSPAEKAGVLAGDILTAVDQRPVDASGGLQPVMDMVEGDEGSQVSITVRRGDILKNMNITRARYEQSLVKFEVLEGYGLISLSGFSGEAVKQFNAAVAEAESKNLAGLIIDVRDNPGGDLGIFEDITDRIVGTGDLIYLQDRAGNRTYTRATTEEKYDRPVVLLVNGKSASAAEAFAGSLQDYECAVLVGSKTFGKGIAQTIYTLSDGSAVHLTTEYYYLPKGRCIHGEGITPDYEVALPEGVTMENITRQTDTQLHKALEVIKGMN